ncbi:MAG: toxin-antitoxin system HicB family antitoxin [Deltaproteobacteria bacterium]|nr:toxin-antitoxin system HicB family antitoxin [Deltaproteobacteria bacterium]
METSDKYGFRVEWSEEDGEYVGICAELPSLSWVAKTAEGALRGIRKVAKEAVRDMAASSEPVPEPFATRRYTGELRVRLPSSLHRRLTIEAAERRRSLNRLIVDKLTGT